MTISVNGKKKQVKKSFEELMKQYESQYSSSN